MAQFQSIFQSSVPIIIHCQLRNCCVQQSKTIRADGACQIHQNHLQYAIPVRQHTSTQPTVATALIERRILVTHVIRAAAARRAHRAAGSGVGVVSVAFAARRAGEGEDARVHAFV
jgi:hypothetical protein